MEQLTLAIRDFINEPRVRHFLYQNKQHWNQLCSCLDTIEDTQLAIEAYKRNTKAADKGHLYLHLYGVLQAMEVQQDATFDFCEAVGEPKSVKDYPGLLKIREVRHRSVGHPTKQTHGRKGLSPAHHFINRMSLNHKGFQLLSTDGTKDEFSDVSLAELLKAQAEEVRGILEAVFQTLQKRDTDHRTTFAADHLANAIPESIGYAFEKLSEAIRGAGPVAPGQWGLKSIRSSVNDFESRLTRRGLDISTYPGLACLYPELQDQVAQLDSFLSGQPSDVTNARSAAVYARDLAAKVKELLEIAREIDKEYSIAP